MLVVSKAQVACNSGGGGVLGLTYKPMREKGVDRRGRPSGGAAFLLRPEK